MRIALSLSLLIGLLSATASLAEDATKEAPNLPYIMVTEGIVGGFVPAHVRQRIVIVNRGEKFELLVMKQTARNVEATYHKGSLPKMEHQALLKSLAEAGLWKLPVELPAGCQDIYKMDTSVAVSADKQFWRNGGPGGCVHGTSKVQPTKEDTDRFAKIVALLKTFADKHATQDGDPKSFQEAAMTVMRDGAKRGAAGKKPATKF